MVIATANKAEVVAKAEKKPVKKAAKKSGK